MNTLHKNVIRAVTLVITISLSACYDSGSADDNDINTGSTSANFEIPPIDEAVEFILIEGNDANAKASLLLSLNPDGPGGSKNQSLRSGDVLQAEVENKTTMIGGLGVDVFVGNSYENIMVGGTEDFNSSVDGDDQGADNRDRAFGFNGDDVFIWSPGDGSDFFNGGEGTDVVVFGLLGEQQDSDGGTFGAPFFNVNPPGSEGSGDFDGIYLDEKGKPVVDVSNSPGFCTTLAAAEYPNEFDLLDIDHLVRFSLRTIANDFDSGDRSDDDGLRVGLSLQGVEYLVCTGRWLGIEVLDLTTNPPSFASLSDIPSYIAEMIR